MEYGYYWFSRISDYNKEVKIMATSDIVKIAIMIGCIAGLLLLAQYTIKQINPQSDFMDGYNADNSYLSGVGNISSGTLNPTNSSLPTASQSISPTTEIQYTDIVQTSLNWIVSNPVTKPIWDLISAPRTFALYIFPGNTFVANVIGAMFYLPIIFLIVSWILSKV
jgi:hypothetical protein